MLTAVESVSTQSLRLTLARQLAEVLMRGVTGQVYKAPQKVASPPQQQGTLTRRREEHVSEGPWKPKKYAGINQIKPCNRQTDGRLAIGFRATSVNAPAGTHAWSAHVRALCVARRSGPLVPRDAALRLLGASTCYRAGWIEEGIELADEALAIEEEREGWLLARCYLYCGIGHQMKAQKTNSRVEKESANETSLRMLLRAVELDDNDHLAFYHLALQYMHVGMLNEAMAALATGKELLKLLHGAPDDEPAPYAELDARSDSLHDDTHSNRDAGAYATTDLHTHTLA
ncbi:jg1999 [Pararge aegeria aegeria]|uniref:Jg1999 protein n=1 Tax=Pararge aegeria aegeria TaxID=348720 RepID=A0A8S4SFC3_9NEOP|nr:jg1999 [Pararge aegeria aegeria]